MEHPRGNAAEGDTLHAMLRGELQAGAVARGEQALVLRRDAPVHDRADGVENIVTGRLYARVIFARPVGSRCPAPP